MPTGTRSATCGSPSDLTDGPLVAVAAHADQIGLIVTHVDEHGYVSVERIGGVAPLLVPGRHFVIHGRDGDVHAVGGRKPTHIIPVEDRDKAPALHEQFLDIGAGGSLRGSGQDRGR